MAKQVKDAVATAKDAGMTDVRQATLNLMLDHRISENPYAFVCANYPWGKHGTPLAQSDGPRKWQREELMFIGDHVLENLQRMSLRKHPLVYKRAIASGRGVGKSCLFSWLSDWNISCHIGSTTIVSANNEAQLAGVTWGELSKWRAMALNKDFFVTTATSVLPAKWFARAVEKQLGIGTEYYYIQARLWAEENPHAYAGAHNPLGMTLMFDEGSGIPASIWDVAQGFFTEPVLHRYHFAFSNPRANRGAFFECFHKNRDFWSTRALDSREVVETDKTLFDQWLAQHGADSDFMRTEVYGQFPEQSENQFISAADVRAAMEREVERDDGAALIMGVDVARAGNDKSVVRFRQGRDARSRKPHEFRIPDNMQLAYRLADLIEQHKPDAVCIDAGGGQGVIDRLRELGFIIIEVNFGASPDDKVYANKRVEMWSRVRDALPSIALDYSPELLDDLTAPERKFSERSDLIMLESKESMKSRGLHSPDHGDALALTFAVKVPRRDMATSRALRGRPVKVNVGHEKLRANRR